MIKVEYGLVMEMANKLVEAGADLKNCLLIYDDKKWYLMDKKDFERNSRA